VQLGLKMKDGDNAPARMASFVELVERNVIRDHGNCPAHARVIKDDAGEIVSIQWHP